MRFRTASPLRLKTCSMMNSGSGLTLLSMLWTMSTHACMWIHAVCISGSPCWRAALSVRRQRTFDELCLRHPAEGSHTDHLPCGWLHVGAKCNTQVVVPHMTENYGASRDPPEKSAPMCTVHSFPHNIDHCLTWARSEFEGMLEKAPSEANSFLENPEKYKDSGRTGGDAQARDQMEKVLVALRSICVQPFTSTHHSHGSSLFNTGLEAWLRARRSWHP